MNQNNLASFLLGTAIGGAAIFFALKHQDEIIDKINELENNLGVDHNDLISRAKYKLDALTQNVQSTIGRFSGSDDINEEVQSLMDELTKLREEMAALKA